MFYFCSNDEIEISYYFGLVQLISLLEKGLDFIAFASSKAKSNNNVWSVQMQFVIGLLLRLCINGCTIKRPAWVICNWMQPSFIIDVNDFRRKIKHRGIFC